MSTGRLDPQLALAAARRGLARAPAQLADGFARAVRDLPAERIEQLMRTPARRVVLEAIFWQLPKRLDGRRAAGISSSIRWRVTGRPDGGADTYQLELVKGQCRVIRSPRGPEARVTITLDGTEFVRIAAGRSNPIQAYFSGRLAVSGDIMLAARLGSLFRIRDNDARGAGSQGQRP
jgi:alkyl sulfatase BDS1-like metallo-beta-lactamase superfamily hydrolase